MTLYRVDFLDHSQDYNQAIECAVYGRVIEEDENCITIETWTMTDEQQEEDLNDTSTFTIIRAAITRIARLVESGAVDRDATLIAPCGRESADLDSRPCTCTEPAVSPDDGAAGGGYEPQGLDPHP